MSILERPPLDPPPGGRPPEDLDGLLRAFYRGEMPAPWPVLEPPAEPVRPAAARRPLTRGRFALAASVAFLLTGHLALSGRFPNFPAFSGGAVPGTMEATQRNRQGGKRTLPVRKVTAPRAGEWDAEREGLRAPLNPMDPVPPRR